MTENSKLKTGLKAHLIWCVMLLLPLLVQAQQQTVSGLVTSQETTEPVANASVIVKGTSRGVTTKADGRYSITVSAGETLTFSAIGFKEADRAVGTQREINVLLENAGKQEEEVVVTALGIKREEKALGYSVKTVSGEELTDALSNNWTDALSGKVAGLNLLKSGGGPAGTNQIILRGERSLTGDNSALIVVDGVIVSGASGTMTGTGSSNYQSADAPVDFGTGLADINPNDIESVSVLKGPGAAALYGSRGANGAIIITTKAGKTNKKGIGVTLNSNTSVGTINRWPDYQYEYGQGAAGEDLYYSYGQSEDGPSTYSSSSAWGPKFDGQMYYQYNPDDPAYYRAKPPERTLWQPYKNNRKDFFRPAVTLTNSLTVSGGNQSTSVRLSYTNTSNKWIVPNTGYGRNNIALALKHKITEKLSVSTNITYSNRKSDNLPNTGYNNQTIMYFMRGITPSMNLDWFKQYWRPGKENIEQTTPFSNLLDNPYFQAYEIINSQDKNGFTGTVQANYAFSQQLNLMVRSGIDLQYDRRQQKRPFDTYRYSYGYYRETNIYTQEANSDFLLQYTSKKTKLFNYGANIGGAIMENRYNKEDLYTEKLVYPGIFNLANSAEAIKQSPFRRSYATTSLYSLINGSFKDYLFLDGSMRVDWASTLASPLRNEVKPFFYPSLNGSLVISDAFKLPREISFWKFRASVASVGGGGTTPYLNAYTYPRAENYTAGLVNPTVIPNEDLKYERTLAYEVGTDFRMFKGRYTLDLTLYNENSFDQILTVPIDPSSGYAFQVINAGNVRNRGIEANVSAKILSAPDKLNWRTYGNASKNDSKILTLPNEDGRVVISTIFGSRGTIEARVGQEFTAMYGYGYKRNPEGQIVYKDGLPQVSEDLIYLGNATATTKAAWGNEFTYKGFRLNVLFDGQWGGMGYSLTHAVLMEEGKLKKTLPGRYNGIVGDGVVENSDGTYSPNTVVVSAQPYYYAHFNRDNLESNTFSTDFIKLREVRLDYSIPPRIIKRLGVQKALIGLYGRDLLVFSNWPAFDPEFGSLNGDGIQKGAEVAQFPSLRTLGFNLSVNF
ncbi:SusC/RagA family TonB-linked outer membrane protein [Niabella drilacis]|uniref:TonB-linked outer membrane protein, SusC/RagA family n=1 Tax=Niabella drilacis (strain DSM 25811 / CCM 8410 / CCUG 62505 / LMG 26954 / E90) TaxID=1285928 RepID=A0A1G6XC25_NIADE|nr:SusC/RagA family TonB-linked outer membrane protein [Niabella drilacis]SDD75622.1 TonB-linked outer membrane protein, SusC/RagA family [Niabella drilacis]